MTTIISGGPIFDTSLGRFVDGHMLVVEGERIHSLESAAGLPSAGGDARLIDVRGGYVLPGLIDCHFHLISRSASSVTDELITAGSIEGVIVARQTVEAGVTTVRDAGCKHHGIFALKRALLDGQIVGPRPYVTGPNPTGTGAPLGWRNGFVDGPLATRKMIREQWLAGADWIKVIISHATEASDLSITAQYLTDDELNAAVDETHSKGMRMSCHCEGLLAATRAVNAGIDGLDHGTVIDERLAADMASRGVYYVPTLWSFTADSGLNWKYFGPDQAHLYEAREREHRLSFQRALAAGVLIGAGSDSPEYIPGKDILVKEIEALAAAGMSRVDAIRAATIYAARIISQDDRLGSLEPGKLADLLVVEGNPLEDLRALASPRLVMQGGQVLVD